MSKKWEKVKAKNDIFSGAMPTAEEFVANLKGAGEAIGKALSSLPPSPPSKNKAKKTNPTKWICNGCNTPCVVDVTTPNREPLRCVYNSVKYFSSWEALPSDEEPSLVEVINGVECNAASISHIEHRLEKLEERMEDNS